MKLEINQLDKILSYRNEDVICRFTDMYHVDLPEAEEIFDETKKFLFISQHPSVFIPDELLIIDEMWHNFILFTPAYHDFSQQMFRKYFHHLPATKEEKEQRRSRLQENPQAAREEYLEKFRKLVEVTYDYLGEQTVVKWYQEYPVKYSKENIKLIRK